MRSDGFTGILPVLDNELEFEMLSNALSRTPIEVGLRIASEEEPKFEFYTSRLGMGYRQILPFWSASTWPVTPGSSCACSTSS